MWRTHFTWNEKNKGKKTANTRRRAQAKKINKKKNKTMLQKQAKKKIRTIYHRMQTEKPNTWWWWYAIFLCTLVWFYLDFSRIFFFKERGININTHCVSISVRVKSNTVIDFIHVSFNDLLQLLFCWFAFLLVVIHSLLAYLCEKMLYDIESTVVLLFSDIWHRWCICVLLLLSAIFVTDFYHHNL